MQAVTYRLLVFCLTSLSFDELWQQISCKKTSQNGTKFGSQIQGALLYITTQIGEFRPKIISWGAKMVKGVKEL